MKSLLTNKFTQACVNMNSLRVQQASQTTLNTNNLGMHQSPQPSLNTDSHETQQVSSLPPLNTNNLGVHQSSQPSVNMNNLAQLKFPFVIYPVNNLCMVQVPKNIVLSLPNKAKNAENSMGVSQTKATTLSNAIHINNTDKVPSNMPIHQNTAVAVSKPNVMNKTTVSNPRVLNNGVTVLSAVTLNQLKNVQKTVLLKQALNVPRDSVIPNSQDITSNCFKKKLTTDNCRPTHDTESQNKTLPVNTSKTVVPADVEVTEQSFSVTLQPVQKEDPPTVQNLDPSTELQCQVKMEESPTVINELESSRLVRGEPQVEKGLKTKRPKENLTDKRTNKDKSNADKMEEIGYKFYKCGICEEAFSDPLVLQTHIRQHKGFQSEVIKCGYCEKIFSCTTGVFAHLKCIHGISCDKPKAGMVEVNLPTYERNEKSVKTIRVIRTKIPKCEMCGKIFPNLEVFAQHKERSDCAKVWFFCIFCKRPVRKETFEETPLPKEIMCNMCQMKWNNLKKNSVITVEHNKEGEENLSDAVHPDFVNFGPEQFKEEVKESYDCLGCQKSYKHKSAYERHLKLMHSTVKPHKCDLCEKAFVFPSSLRGHRLSHMKTKTFACDKCPKTFKLRYALKKHMWKHEPGRFPCDVCGKILKCKQRLREHKRLHTGEKPFLCEICGRRFYSRMARVLHMNTHDSSTKILCEICGKLFTEPYLRHHLVRHRIHDDLSLETRSRISDIPYVCEHCGKGFCERLRYEKHKSSKHKHKTNVSYSEEIQKKKKNPDARPRCGTCGKSFTNKWTLEAHVALHRGLMRVACDKCNMVMHKNSLRRHMLKMHKTTKTSL
ncbi:zinc finger protein 479-like [Saccostrea echinata]|uniref:zinc finger protein 479-like n=1 Tax=Saccostrea echinata TaxID=191078 RepID=UPI002A7F9BD4|nr:zinc finger protein 479-like [Saccostrea echinata]